MKVAYYRPLDKLLLTWLQMTQKKLTTALSVKHGLSKASGKLGGLFTIP
jgi:hypothetical protein